MSKKTFFVRTKNSKRIFKVVNHHYSSHNLFIFLNNKHEVIRRDDTIPIETIRVKITKRGDFGQWYNKHIGEIFEVLYLDEYGLILTDDIHNNNRTDDYYSLVRYINFSDCEILDTFKVKVNRCSNKDYWYEYHIGKTYNVITGYDMTGRTVYKNLWSPGSNCGLFRYIYPEDCEIIEDNKLDHDFEVKYSNDENVLNVIVHNKDIKVNITYNNKPFEESI